VASALLALYHILHISDLER